MSGIHPTLREDEQVIWTSSGNSAPLQLIQKFYDVTISESYFGKDTVYSSANIFLTNKRLIVNDAGVAQMNFELEQITSKWLTGNGKEFFNFSVNTMQGVKKYQFKTGATLVSQTEAQKLHSLCPVSSSPANSMWPQQESGVIAPQNITTFAPNIKTESMDPEIEKLEAEKYKIKKKLLLKRKLEKARKLERQLDYEPALDLYRELERVEDIRRINKLKQGVGAPQGQPTTIVHGNYIDDRDRYTTNIDDRATTIKDSVVSHANFDAKDSDVALKRKIEQLKELRDDGLISDDIFEAKKLKLTNKP